MKLFFLFAIGLVFSCNSFYENTNKSEIQILTESIASSPNDISLLLERVDYNKSQDQLESALYDLKQIVTLDSLNSNYQYLIAEAYFESSKKPNASREFPLFAKDHLNNSIRLDRNNYKAHALLGELMLVYGKYKEAIFSLNSSLKIKYNQEKTHMLLGYVFKQVNQYDKAINCFRNSINVNPDFKESYAQLGQIFHILDDTLAIEYYNNALELDPDDHLILYNKALFYQSRLEWNRALDAYADLHNKSPFHSSGHYNLGFIHMELGLFDVAANNFSDAIYSNSNFFEAYYSRGNCFETLGNIEQAQVDYTRAIEINPEYTFAIDALKSLIEKNQKYNK